MGILGVGTIVKGLGALAKSSHEDQPTSSMRRRPTTFKPAPDITTPPPPKRNSVSANPSTPNSQAKVRSLSQPTIASTKTPAFVSECQGTTQSNQVDDTSERSHGGTYSPNTSRPALHINKKPPPPLPPRAICASPPALNDVSAVVVYEHPPVLPPRTYSVLNPPLPPRAYRAADVQNLEAAITSGGKIPPSIKSPPKKPQHLVAPPLSEPYSSSDTKPTFARVMSASSVSSTGSTSTSQSIASSATSSAISPMMSSNISTISSTSNQGLLIAELVKNFESRQEHSKVH